MTVRISSDNETHCMEEETDGRFNQAQITQSLVNICYWYVLTATKNMF